jgi:hypothetical protein
MRRIASVLTILSASVLLTGSTLMADERMEYNTPVNGKDVCLLTAMNCANEVDSIQMRIERLNNEIAKGTDVYTSEELKVLQNELQDNIRNLETIVTGG